MLTHHTRRRARSFRQRAVPYTFVGPAFALLATFGLLPIVIAVVVSFTDMDIAGLANPGDVKFIGFDNYTTFKDSSFWNAVRNTAIYVAIGTPSIVFISMTIAVLLDLSQSRFFRIPPRVLLRAVDHCDLGHLIDLGLPVQHPVRVAQLHALRGRDRTGRMAVRPQVRQAVAGCRRHLAGDGADIIIFLAAPLRRFLATCMKHLHSTAQPPFSRPDTSPCRACDSRYFSVTVTTLINWMQFFDEPFVLTRGNDTREITTSVSIYIYNEIPVQRVRVRLSCVGRTVRDHFHRHLTPAPTTNGQHRCVEPSRG